MSPYQYLTDWMGDKYFYSTTTRRWYRTNKTNENVWESVDRYGIEKDLIGDFPEIPLKSPTKGATDHIKALDWMTRVKEIDETSRTNLIPYADACLDPVTLERVEYSSDQHWVSEDGLYPIPSQSFPGGSVDGELYARLLNLKPTAPL